MLASLAGLGIGEWGVGETLANRPALTPHSSLLTPKRRRRV